MKSINLILGFMAMICSGLSAQVVTFRIDTIYYFQHDSAITTNEAMLQNLVEYTGESYPHSQFSFDLDNMELTHTDKNGSTHVLTLLNKEIFNAEKNTFHCDFISFDTHNRLDVIFSTGVDPKDGYVVWIRWNKEVEGRKLLQGYFATNLVVN
jgi:hypothetical protein